MRSRLLLLVGLIIAFGIAGCRQPHPKQTGTKSADQLSTSNPKETLDAKLHTAKVLIRDEKGRPLWEAQFAEGSGSKTDSNTIGKLRNVTASLYKDGKVASTLVAPLLEADNQSREIKASGGVRIVSKEDGTLVTCQQIVWKSKENRVYCTGNVKMTRQNVTGAGNSFVADTSLTSAKFLGQTSISIH